MDSKLSQQTSASSASTSAQFGELTLLLRQQEVAWRTGESLSLESIHATLPKDESGNEQLLCLICNEVYLRQQRGETPYLAEYQKRFPHIANALRIQWAVDELIDAHRSSGSETRPPLSDTQNSLPRFSNSTRLGNLLNKRYELKREIGRGGMGVVYLAQDVKLGRSVAVKMLLSQSMQGQEALARFRSEAEMLARTVHPNIVQVFDVGELENDPFIVMEYCDSGSLSDYLRGVPVEWRVAAGWMQRIADAVSAAHAVGVAHRDLKPSNILIARSSRTDASNTDAIREQNKTLELANLEQTTAKVTDFGLAKRLDTSANLTATGDTIGTPAYMAPEQLSIQDGIDPKLSDIYSLGAILYECLTGRPPVRGASPLETIELLRTQDPVSIRHLQPLVPVDVSIIAHKCLQREPSQRYANVDAFNDDLQRLLDGRPILAKPTPAWRKAWKWARRRPAVATTWATAVVALTALLIGWAMFTKEIQAAKESAERERDSAKTQTQRAERNATWAMEAVDKLISQVGDKSLASIPQMDRPRKELLQAAVAFCLKFAEDRDNPDPDARNQVALAYRRLAKIHRALGETKPWLESLEKAAAIHRELVAEFPRSEEYLTEFSKTLNNLSNVQGEFSGIEQVVATLEEAIAIKMELVIRQPKSAEHRSSLATSLYSIGSKYRIVKPEKSEEVFLQSEELLKGLIAEFPENLAYRRSAMGLYQNWTSFNYKMGKHAQAAKTALLTKRLAESDPRGITHAEVRAELATAFELIGTTQGVQPQTRRDSLAAFDKQLELIEGLITDFPDRPDHQESFLRCQFNRANIARDLCEYVLAESVAETTAELGNKWNAKHPENSALKLFTARLQVTSAHIALDKGEYRNAIKSFDNARAVYEPIMDLKEGDLDIICQANHFRACRALTSYYLGESQQGMDGMMATFDRMRIALSKQPDFFEAKRLYIFSAANYVLMKIRANEPQAALAFALEVPVAFPNCDPWIAQVLIAAANTSMGDIREAKLLLQATPGEEIQSMMWPDRMSVVVAAQCYRTLSSGQTLPTEERDRLSNEFLQIAGHELVKANQNGFFRPPNQRDVLFKYPEVVSILDQLNFRLDPP